MDFRIKTREELIRLIEELQHENHSLKAAYDKDRAANRHASDVLKQTRRNYISFFNSVSELLAILDESLHIIHVNSSVINRLGFLKNDLRGISVLKLYSPESQSAIAEFIDAALKGKTGHGLVTLMTKEGSLVPAETKVTAGYWDNKPSIFVVSKDISTIVASEEKFSKLFYLNPSACELINSEDLTIVDINDAFSRLLGYTKQEIVGKTSVSIGILSPEAWEDMLHKTNPDGKMVNAEVVLKAKNGELKHVLRSAEEIYIQGKKYRYAVSYDITELMLAKEKAEENQRIFKAIADHSPLAICISAGSELKTQYVNPAFVKMFGYTVQDLPYGSYWWPLVYPDTNYRILIQNEWLRRAEKAIKTRSEIEPMETIVTCKDGTTRNILWEFISTGPENLGFGMDLTDRKHTESELIKAKERAEESDRLKSAFLQNLSHEIRTPMNAIMGFSTLMAKNFSNQSKHEKYSEIINQRCRDLLEIIDEILDIAKIESGQLRVNKGQCKLDELFSELISFFTEYQRKVGKQHISFVMQHPDDPAPTIVTDKVKLKQILINLISNAFKFTEKGSIAVTYSIHERREIIFNVSDTGIGIPRDKFGVIFERFTQLNPTYSYEYGGTGLGLSIVEGLVSLLSGRIWLESEPDKGTAFYFSIPYEKPRVVLEESSQSGDRQSYHFADKTVLVVEDDMYNAEYLKEVLSETGLRVIHCKSGELAVQTAISEPLDLVLMDIRLPDIDGYEAAHRIRSTNPELKIIAQTAYATQDDRQKALDSGFVDYIAKPTHDALLLSMINRYL